MLKEKIQADAKAAMKAKDELRLSVLRLLSSAIHNREIEKHGELTEEEIVAAIRSELKKRKDAAEQFLKGGRKELADKEAAEAKILETYLPGELPDEEIEKVAREAIAILGEVTQKDFGRVMGEVMKRVKGQASGDRISAAVRKFLQ